MFFYQENIIAAIQGARLLNEPANYMPIRHNYENHKSHQLILKIEHDAIHFTVDGHIPSSLEIQAENLQKGYLSLVSDSHRESYGSFIRLQILQDESHVLDLDFRTLDTVEELSEFFQCYYYSSVNEEKPQEVNISNFWEFSERHTLKCAKKDGGRDDANNICVLTYKKRMSRDFTVILDFEQSTYRYGLILGCEAGTFPYYRSLKTSSFKSLEGLYAYVESEGFLCLRGKMRAENYTSKKYLLARSQKAVPTFYKSTEAPTIMLRDHSLLYHLSSDATYHFEGKTISAMAGTVLYIPAKTPYIAKYTTNTHIRIGFLMPDGKTFEPSSFKPKLSEKFEYLFRNIADLFMDKPIGYHPDAHVNFYKIQAMILKENTKKSIINCDSVPEKLKPAFQYLQANFSNPDIPIPHLAELCYISEPYFRRLYLKHFGISPQKHIQQMRINYAAFLLDSGQYKISEVARLSGFPDTKYFTATFHKVMGLPPSRWMKEPDAH